MAVYILVWTLFEVGTPHPYVDIEGTFKNMEQCSKHLVVIRDVMGRELGEGQCIRSEVRK
jgi:hypothetical protein